jgi:hypothetical protein
VLAHGVVGIADLKEQEAEISHGMIAGLGGMIEEMGGMIEELGGIGPDR